MPEKKKKKEKKDRRKGGGYFDPNRGGKSKYMQMLEEAQPRSKQEKDIDDIFDVDD